MEPLQRFNGLLPDRTPHRDIRRRISEVSGGVTEIGLKECGIDREIGADEIAVQAAGTFIRPLECAQLVAGTPKGNPLEAARVEAERLDQTAEELSAQVRRNIQRSSNYVLGVVLFAVSLFFAGMSTKLTSAGPRKALLIVGCVLFLGAVIWIATFPISLAV
jgi:hypothetical protein